MKIIKEIKNKTIKEEIINGYLSIDGVDCKLNCRTCSHNHVSAVSIVMLLPSSVFL